MIHIKGDYYILEKNGIIKQVSFERWSKWFENEDRHIKLTELNKEITISTVF